MNSQTIQPLRNHVLRFGLGLDIGLKSVNVEDIFVEPFRFETYIFYMSLEKRKLICWNVKYVVYVNHIIE